MPVNDATSGALQGLLFGAALPAASLADYEARLLPGERRRIEELVNEAARRRRIFATSPGSSASGLAKHTRLGDIITHSSKPTMGVDDMVRNFGKANLADLAFAPTGSAFPHVEMMAGRRRAVNTGRGDYGQLTKLLKRMKQNIAQGRKLMHGINASRMFSPDAATPRDVPKALRNASYDIFREMEDAGTPKVSVVSRPGDFTRAEQRALKIGLIKNEAKPYSRGRAALSGLFRVAVPGGDRLADAAPRKLLSKVDDFLSRTGTFCSGGVCKVLEPTSAKGPLSGLSMPTDFLDRKLVGINLNSDALMHADKGSRGIDRKASAAKNFMRSALKESSRMRRHLGGGMIGILGGLGALGGAALGARRNAISDGSGS